MQRFGCISNSCCRSQQTSSVKVVVDYPVLGRAPNSRLDNVPVSGCPVAATGAPSHSVPRAGLWTRGGLQSRELKFMGGHPSHRVEGKPRACRALGGRTVTLFHSATPFCRLLTKQSENTAPSLLLSEVRDVVGVFLFLFFSFPPSLPFPSPLSESSSQAAAYNAGS